MRIQSTHKRGKAKKKGRKHTGNRSVNTTEKDKESPKMLGKGDLRLMFYTVQRAARRIDVRQKAPGEIYSAR